MSQENDFEGITIVSAFFDINRENYVAYSRTVDAYINSFLRYLDMKYTMVIFIDDRYLHRLLKYYDSCLFKNKIFIPINKEWLCENIYAWKQLERDKSIINSNYYKNFLHERILSGHPENIYSEYNIVNHSKIDFINYALKNNYIMNDFVCWSDFGYYNSILNNNSELFPTTILDINKFNVEKINVMLYNDITKEDKNILDVAKNGKVTITGTFYGGPCKLMGIFQELYHQSLDELYSHNISDDDQHVLLRCYLKKPDLFELFKEHNRWPRGLNFFQCNG